MSADDGIAFIHSREGNISAAVPDTVMGKRLRICAISRYKISPGWRTVHCMIECGPGCSCRAVVNVFAGR